MALPSMSRALDMPGIYVLPPRITRTRRRQRGASPRAQYFRETAGRVSATVPWMLFLRAALLEFLICFHVVGGAVLFRRLFPRESPWLAFILPVLIIMTVLNFVEHFLPLPNLGWLLPLTMGGLGWVLLRSPGVWEGMKLPVILFLLVFTWVFFIRCLHPEITCNTEGPADMARMLDFCLGSTIPPIDTWNPPNDHGGYYTFQFYGASLVKRLFSLDIGTGYNLGYSLLNTLTFLVGAGAAYAISGGRTWVSVTMLLVLLANFTGAAVFLLFWNNWYHTPDVDVFDTRQAVDIYDGWGDPARHNPFIWPYGGPTPALRLFTPAFNTYFAEFHPNLGGHFMALGTLLAANETFKLGRSNWPWICLLLFPFITIITAAWYLFVVSALCLGGLAMALWAGRRPQDWKWVLSVAFVGVVLLWPSVDSLLSGTYPAPFYFTAWADYTTPKEFIIQWWPVVVPWIFLCFIWDRLNLLVRWIHFVLPILLIFVEVVTFDYRVPMVEKMWGAVYGVGLVTFLPLIFIQSALPYRILTFGYLFITTLFLGAWAKISTDYVDWHGVAFHLSGDTVFANDPQKNRLLQTLKHLHNANVLNGKGDWSYNESPGLVGFSENRCYIAWYAKEDECGHIGEAEYRNQQSNEFFSGEMADRLSFLRNNDIAAVMIYPNDQIPDDTLAKIKTDLAPDYDYLDFKGVGGNPSNAGIFMRQPGAPVFGSNATVNK
jgi:hypothetical protein